MKQPLIGISGSHMIDQGGPFPGYKRSYVNDDYVQSVLEAGGIPVIIPFQEDEATLKALVERLDGLILSGGHDIAPQFYGEEPERGLGAIWPERDIFDMRLLAYAKEYKLPIMGICRGHQIINVAHKGSLYQDLPAFATIKHSQNQTAGLPTHSMVIEKDSKLFGLLDSETVMVNSHHHQIVKEVGEGLRVVGRAKDTVVEAMEGIDYPYLRTYQFHPEMMRHTELNAAIFKDFVEAAKKEA